MRNRDYPLAEMEQRRVMYSVLGRVFEDAMDLSGVGAICVPPACDALSDLRQAGVASDAVERLLSRSSRATEESVKRLRAEYDALFRSENRIFSCASCWTAHAPDVAGVWWERALAFYRRHGVSVRSDRACVADHAGTELHVASLLAARACEACSDEELERNTVALREMLADVILPWLPDFFAAVEADRRADFYKDAASVARGFLEYEGALLVRSTSGEPALA